MMLIAGMLDCYMENPIFVILKLCTSLGVNHIIFYMFFKLILFSFLHILGLMKNSMSGVLLISNYC